MPCRSGRVHQVQGGTKEVRCGDGAEGSIRGIVQVGEGT